MKQRPHGQVLSSELEFLGSHKKSSSQIALMMLATLFLDLLFRLTPLDAEDWDRFLAIDTAELPARLSNDAND